MIGVQKDRKIKFFAQASHQGRNLTDPHKLALALRHPYEHRDLQFPREAKTAFNITRSATLKCPTAAPFCGA